MTTAAQLDLKILKILTFYQDMSSLKSKIDRVNKKHLVTELQKEFQPFLDRYFEFCSLPQNVLKYGFIVHSDM